MRFNAFYERVKTYKQKSDSKEDLVVLIQRIREREIKILLAVAKSIIE